MFTKELELVRGSVEKDEKDELEGTETAIRDLEKQLKQKEWELTDEKNMNRAKVAELEAEMEQIRSLMSKSQERFEHKHAELDRYAREKEQARGGVLGKILMGECRWDSETLNLYQTTFMSFLQPYSRLDTKNPYPIPD